MLRRVRKIMRARLRVAPGLVGFQEAGSAEGSPTTAEAACWHSRYLGSKGQARGRALHPAAAETVALLCVTRMKGKGTMAQVEGLDWCVQLEQAASHQRQGAGLLPLNITSVGSVHVAACGSSSFILVAV